MIRLLCQTLLVLYVLAVLGASLDADSKKPTETERFRGVVFSLVMTLVLFACLCGAGVFSELAVQRDLMEVCQ